MFISGKKVVSPPEKCPQNKLTSKNLLVVKGFYSIVEYLEVYKHWKSFPMVLQSI